MYNISKENWFCIRQYTVLMLDLIMVMNETIVFHFKCPVEYDLSPAITWEAILCI